MRRQAGFTLIELMVVMLLLGVAFTYGIINIDLLVPSASLDKAARDIGGMLRRLRSLAVFHGRSYKLEYDLDEHRYRVFRPTSKTEQEEGMPEIVETDWFTLPDEISFENLQFSDKDEISGGTMEIEFTAKGAVVGHLVHLISSKITHEERKRFTVELNPITGLVSYTRGEKKYAQVRDAFEFR
ncbi:MAG: prepilin-type N-terminal cleavage/methylation domain-containing protein [Planctomycetota bacterium]|nr:prepilin-type N-terminal cleavage/methylation domain-containing protein [Planctomycetota bacterium]